MKHLWEIDHPYYGADGYDGTAGSFAELKADVDASDEDMNVIYRWDWFDPAKDEYREREEFAVYLLMPRKSAFWSIKCPITKDQEAEVLEWLKGPRVLGSLRTLWEPILDETEASA